MSKVIYGQTQIEIPAGGTVDQIVNILKTAYPELANATYTLNENGDFVVTVATATKGA